MSEEQKNLDSVKGMTKWQRMRFEMLVSASGAFIRALTYVIFIAMFLMLATRIQSQTWYNWKNDQRVAQLEERVAFLEKTAVLQPTEEYNPQLLQMMAPYEMSNKAPSREEVRDAWVNRVWLANTPNQIRSATCPTDALNHHWRAGSQEEPHKAMRHYWTRENDHPPTEENKTFLSNKLSNWTWKHNPAETFLVLFGILFVFGIVVFELPMLLFGKPRGKKSYEELKKEAQEFKPPELEEPKKD